MTADAAEALKADAAPIDREHLARMTHGMDDLAQEVLQLFVAQSAVYLGQLEAADTAKCWHDAAHSLKGSAKAVGAWQVAAGAEALERRADTYAACQAAGELSALKAVLQTTYAFIDEMSA